MKKLTFTLLVFLGFSINVFAKTIKVGVIDTGFAFNSTWPNLKAKDDQGFKLVKPKLCKDRKNFTNETVNDINGHGTHIAGIIAKFAQNKNYCLVIIKYYSSSQPAYQTVINMTNAINYAVKEGVDIINISSTGHIFNPFEAKAVKNALNNHIRVIAAAGNEGRKITYKDAIYPAMDDLRVSVVESLQSNGLYLADYSNFNHLLFHYKEIGEHVLSLLPNNSIGYMSGTSQATATLTGKIISNY